MFGQYVGLLRRLFEKDTETDVPCEVRKEQCFVILYEKGAVQKD